MLSSMEKADSYKTIEKKADGYYEEKKSRFFGLAFPISSEEEARNILEKIQTEHYNASHFCYAYRLHTNPISEKAMDDGEPHGTAGHVILNLLRSEELENVMVVVVRYFGGTLLGTGGLSRAYKEAAKDALLHAALISMQEALKFSVRFSYGDYETIRRKLSPVTGNIISAEYGDFVKSEIIVLPDSEETFRKEITEWTQDRAIIEESQMILTSVTIDENITGAT